MENIGALEKRLWSRSSTKRLNWRENGWKRNLRSATQNTNDASGNRETVCCSWNLEEIR